MVNPRVPVATKDVFQALGLRNGELLVGATDVLLQDRLAGNRCVRPQPLAKSLHGGYLPGLTNANRRLSGCWPLESLSAPATARVQRRTQTILWPRPLRHLRPRRQRPSGFGGANRAGRRSARSHAADRHTADGRARHQRRLRYEPCRTAGAGAYLPGGRGPRQTVSTGLARERRRHRRQALGKGQRPRPRRRALRYARAARRRRALSDPYRGSRTHRGSRPRRRTRSRSARRRAGGAIIGAIVGGKKGAAIGTAAGGGAGTAVVLSTRGKEVRLPKGSALTLRLSEPVTIRVKH